MQQSKAALGPPLKPLPRGGFVFSKSKGTNSKTKKPGVARGAPPANTRRPVVNTTPLRRAMVQALNSLDVVPNALTQLHKELSSTDFIPTINIIIKDRVQVLNNMCSLIVDPLVKKYKHTTQADKDIRFSLFFRVEASGNYTPMPDLVVAQNAFKVLAKTLDVPVRAVPGAQQLMINPASNAGRSTVAGAAMKVLQDQEIGVKAEQTRLLQALKAAVTRVAPRVKNMMQTQPGHREFMNHLATLQYTPQNFIRPRSYLISAAYSNGLLKPLAAAANVYKRESAHEALLIKSFKARYERTIEKLDEIVKTKSAFSTAVAQMAAAGLPMPTWYEIQRDPKDIDAKDPVILLEAMKVIMQAHTKAKTPRANRSPAQSPSRASSPTRSPSRASSPARSPARASSPARNRVADRALWTATGMAAGAAAMASTSGSKKKRRARAPVPAPAPPPMPSWAPSWVPAPPTSRLPTYLPNNAPQAVRAQANRKMRRSVAKTSAQLVPRNFWTMKYPPASASGPVVPPPQGMGSRSSSSGRALPGGMPQISYATSRPSATTATAKGGLAALGVVAAAMGRRMWGGRRSTQASPPPSTTTQATSKRRSAGVRQLGELGNILDRPVYSLRSRNVRRKNT